MSPPPDVPPPAPPLTCYLPTNMSTSSHWLVTPSSDLSPPPFCGARWGWQRSIVAFRPKSLVSVFAEYFVQHKLGMWTEKRALCQECPVWIASDTWVISRWKAVKIMRLHQHFCSLMRESTCGNHQWECVQNSLLFNLFFLWTFVPKFLGASGGSPISWWSSLFWSVCISLILIWEILAENGQPHSNLLFAWSVTNWLCVVKKQLLQQAVHTCVSRLRENLQTDPDLSPLRWRPFCRPTKVKRKVMTIMTGETKKQCGHQLRFWVQITHGCRRGDGIKTKDENTLPLGGGFVCNNNNDNDDGIVTYIGPCAFSRTA